MKALKLNHDCMRDCLLYLESIETVRIGMFEDDLEISMEPIFIGQLFTDIKNWTNQDIFYALFNLEQGGYIDVSDGYSNNAYDNFCVNYMTLRGHEFLDAVRDDGRWQGIKKGLGAVRDYSLSAISAIAEGMTTGAISAYLSRQATN